MDRQQALQQIEVAIKKLQVEYERFFNGTLDAPPRRLSESIRVALAEAHREPNLSVAESFRLQQLEGRYNTYRELYNRRILETEERGRVRIAREAPRAYDLESGVVIGLSSGSAEAIEALYAGLCRGGGTSPRFDLDTFKGYLDKQIASIHDKTGCSEVRFRLVQEAGEVKLKARPIRH